MDQFLFNDFEQTLAALVYYEAITALIALGIVVFVLWLLYTWVMSYRRWAESDIAIRRGMARESAAKETKLQAEIARLRHEMTQKGLVDADDHAPHHPMPLNAAKDSV